MFGLTVLSFLVASKGLLGVYADRQFTMLNKCPLPITLYINGVSQVNLAADGGFMSNTQPDDWSGFIYTSANGGNQNGQGTTRAGFYGDSDYYYIVYDPNYFNVGVEITPLYTGPNNGFCAPAVCTGLPCSAYNFPPTDFQPPAATPPNPPLFACPQLGQGYSVVFCPDGSLPPSEGISIHPNGDCEKCLDVRGAVYENGTPVQIYDCNGTGAQKWLINRGNTKVQVAGTNFCLDAGSEPGNGVGGKIWTCYDNLPAQAWNYTDDNRITLFGEGQCLDLPNGVLTDSNQVQTWECTDNDNNQVWTE